MLEICLVSMVQGIEDQNLQLKEILTTLREMALFVKILFSVFKTKISTNNPKHKTLIKTQKLLSH